MATKKGLEASRTLVIDEQADFPPPANPEPIFVTDEDGVARPLLGGSFVRQPDGTLIRNQEA